MKSPPGGALVPRPAADLVHYIEEPRSLIAGNAVRLLRNGVQAFPAWLDAIDRARQRISMEMYIFADDKIGQRFGDALCRAAQRGVTVRLIYDFIGCRSTSPLFFQNLRRAGVHTIVYHAYRFWRPRFWTLLRRNHRKTLIMDGTLAFTGGLNIANEWLPRDEGGDGWLDSAVELRGPAVRVLETSFLRVWNRRARRKARLDPKNLTTPAPAGDTRLAIVGNTELLDRFAIRRAAIHALRTSRTRAYLANPYFVPDRGFLRALCRAAARGVDVRLLVPARSDSRTLDYAARATFPQLLRCGVRIFQHPNVVHSKALLVDDDFVSLGSYNLDHWSLAYNLEVVVNTLDRPYATEVARMLEEDMGTGEEIHLEAFLNRPMITSILERLAYKLRLWL